MALGISYLVSQGVCASAIAGISNLTTKVYTKAKVLYDNENPDIRAMMKELDLNYKIDMVKSILPVKTSSNVIEPITVVDDYITGTVVRLSVSDKYVKTPMDVCLGYLTNCLYTVIQELEAINGKILNHKRKYFSYYRKLDLSKEFRSIQINSNLMMEKFDIYLKLVSSNNKLSYNFNDC